MSIPRLTVPLVLETAEKQPDGMGGFRMSWRDLGILHARLKSGSARLRGGEAGAQSEIDWQITLRAFPKGDPRRPLVGQRLRMGQRIFRIEGVAEADASGRHLTVFAQEG
ncbi:MAG: head-tail adaptor protein [Paracoccus sp. (in: a-proteobacteria)]